MKFKLIKATHEQREKEIWIAIYNVQNSKSGKAEKKNLLFSDISLDWLLGYDTRSIHNKSKSKKLGLHQTKNLLYSKENNRMKW